MRINISISEETTEKLKAESIQRYGNMRSVSKLIEDLVKGMDLASAPNPEMRITDGKFIVVQTSTENFLTKNIAAAVSILEREGKEHIQVSEVTLGDQWEVNQVSWETLYYELVKMRSQV